MYCSTKQFECSILILIEIIRNTLASLLQTVATFLLGYFSYLLFGRAIQEGKNCTRKCIIYPVFLAVLIEGSHFH